MSETGMPQSARRGLSATNVGPAERIASVAGGLGLLGGGLALRSKLVWAVAALGGGYLLFRGATGYCVSYDMLNIKRAEEDGKDAGIQVDRAVTINRPRAEVYGAWRNLENLPRFMTHLESVQVTGDRRSHWVARAPLGRTVEWDAEMVEDRENELIHWASVAGSVVRNTGRVRFQDAPGGRGTEVHVSLTYNPVGGSLGAAVAKLLGEEPGTQVREDLRHYKQMLEAGEIPTNDGQTSGRKPAGDGANGARGNGRERQRRRDVVATASEDSFPASDPPAWIGG
ncbi:MAG TPA: SRPBCC family protein [Anaerolineae bacterium]|nr:SRPBCC family protein [Anaerolineae bacterium]